MKGMKMLCLLVALFLVGCATPSAQLSNVSQVADDKAIGRLYVGPFLDMRKGGNTDTTILGTKRGGYGNPLGRVRDERGADEFVREHLINAARASFCFAERKPDNIMARKQDGKWVVEIGKDVKDKRPILVGVIGQLLVETGYSRATEVNIDLDLIDSDTGKTLWTSKLINRETGGMGGGIFEKVDKLKDWLAKTLQDEALKKFASPEFQNAVKLNKQ